MGVAKVGPKTKYLLDTGERVILEIRNLRSNGSGNQQGSVAHGQYARAKRLSGVTEEFIAESNKTWLPPMRTQWLNGAGDARKSPNAKGMKFVGQQDYLNSDPTHQDADNDDFPSSRPKRIYEVVKITGAGVCDHLGAIAYALCRQYLSGEYFAAWVGVSSDRVCDHTLCITGPVASIDKIGTGTTDPSKWVIVDAWPINAKAVKYEDHFLHKDATKQIIWYIVAQGKGKQVFSPSKMNPAELDALKLSMAANEKNANYKPDYPNYNCDVLWDGDTDYELDNTILEQ
jgi:hypothetical protein